MHYQDYPSIDQGILLSCYFTYNSDGVSWFYNMRKWRVKEVQNFKF